MVGSHAELFRDAQPPRAQIAIYDDTRNSMLLHGMAADDLVKRCHRGAYATFWRAGYPVEFVNAEALRNDEGRTTNDESNAPSRSSFDLRPSPLPYKVIVLPAALLLDAVTGAALRSFVEAGGTLIAFAKCAWVDDRSWSWADQPGAGLDALFGVQAGEIERIADCKLQIANCGFPQFAICNLQSAIPGYWHRQPLTPVDDAQALAYFDDGGVAIVCRAYGQGQTFYIGTHLDAAALESEAAAALLLALAESAGLQRPLTLDAPASRCTPAAGR